MRSPLCLATGWLLLLLWAFGSPVLASPCSPEQRSAKVSLSIEKIHRFFQKSRGAPSFNYDRLDYLLRSFEQNAVRWEKCRPGRTSSQAALLISKIHDLRARVARERSLSSLTGDPAPSGRTLRSIEEILSRFPQETKSSLPVPPGPSGAGVPLPSSVFWKWFLPGGAAIGGVFFLVLILRGSLRKNSPDAGPVLGRGDLGFLKESGLRWSASRFFRKDLLERIRKRIGKQGRSVRLRAQLLIQEKDRTWKVVDEVSDDEGGFLRTFGETPENLDAREKIEEISLGDGEVRTHLTLPVSGEEGESYLMVVDAITAPDILREIPDPSGVLSVLRMKELLVQLALESGSRDRARIGVISLFFDEPGIKEVLGKTGEEAERAKSFIVREAVRLTWPGMLVFGEPPGFFHLVLNGRSETETGVWIRALSGGMGPDSREGTGGEDDSWFRKIRVAYTQWEKPDPEKLEPFLGRVRENLQKLVNNPSIRTVIDT